MYIGKAAQLSGTTIKCIRHYEEIGLLPPPQRRGAYRIYTSQSVELLTFIKCAQQLGFKLKEMQAILADHRGQALPWAVVLHFRLSGERRVRGLCIPRDALARDVHRRLRVCLKFSRRRWQAPE